MNNNPSQSPEELAQYHGWDGQLKKLLLSLPRRALDRYILETIAYDKEGWRYILPELPPNAAVLCLDTRFGTTAAAFAETGASITVIHPCATTVRIMQHRLAASGLTNIKIMHVPPEATALPFADNSFDAFIHHDVTGLSMSNNAATSSIFAGLTTAMLKESFRLLKQDGFAYFGMKNPHGYTELKKILQRSANNDQATTHKLISLRLASHRIKQAGFRDLQRHAYLMENGLVYEIVPPTGYRSVKNSLAINEKIKQILLGKRGLKFLAPAFGLICGKNRLRACHIQGFANNLVSQKILAESDKRPCFQRYQPLPGKVFVTFGKAADSDENVIIVIPKLPNITAWRQKEITIVNEIRSLSPLLAAKLPRLYLESVYRGESYFALSEIPGITIDRRVPHIERCINNAVDFLIQFNRITARETVISDEIYTALIGALIKQVTDVYRSTAEIMGRIERQLRALVLGKSTTTVWFHGDYKLENLIFNQNNLEIAGIIDWEQSRRMGLPWLDLLYLIAYNRIMAKDTDFFGVYRHVIIGANRTPQEQSIIDTYAAAFPLANDMQQVINSLFFIHHIGCRYKYKLNLEGDRHNIFTALAEMETRLAQLTA